MKTELTIKNFRVFDHKDGGTVRLAPITLLTGCNSSGKSSVVKALVLLKDFFEQVKTNVIEQKCFDFDSSPDIDYNECCIDFMNNPYAQLGTVDLVFNKESRKDEDNPDSYYIQVSYTVNSEKLDDVVLVEMKFLENDDSSTTLDEIKAKIHKGMNSPYFYSPMYPMGSNVSLLFDNFMIHVLKSLINDNIIVELSNIKRAKECGDKDIFRFGYLKDCLDVLATYMNPKDFEAYKISIYKKAVDVYCHRYIINEKHPVTGDILVRTEDFVFSKYKGKESLYIEAAKRKTMFPLPLWNLLEGKDLKESQDEINSLLKDSEDLIYTRSGVLKAQDFLPLVNSMFTWIGEEPASESLLSYFKECEADFWSNYDIFARDSSRRRSWGNKVLWLEEKIFPIIGDIYNLDPRDYIGGLCSNDLFFIIYCIAYLIGGKSNEQYFVNEPYKRTDSIVAFRKEDNRKYVRSITDNIPVVFNDLQEYYIDVVSEVISPDTFKQFKYFGDSVVKIKRLYTREEGDLFGNMLVEYLKCNQNHPEIIKGDFVDKWVRKFGLGDRVSIRSTAEGLGVIAKLHRTPDDEGRLLADEGFGVTKLIGTLLNVEMAILKADGKEVTIAIEEPENHLHPKYQSLLAEMFADAYKNYGIHFIVETHSEYMVRKLQVLVARKELTPEEVSLQYFYNPDIEQRPQGEPQVKDIPIREDGILLAPFGPGFLDEADNLVMDILTAKK